MRTSNPALNDNVFRDTARENVQSQTMTLSGTVAKTGVLLCLLVAAAGYTWAQTHALDPGLAAEASETAATVVTETAATVVTETVATVVTETIATVEPKPTDPVEPKPTDPVE